MLRDLLVCLASLKIGYDVSCWRRNELDQSSVI
jgi:hypothetical protein